MYAIIPAAGHSRRMGQPKLLLPWHQGTVLDCVLQTWLQSQIEKVIVVARADDAELLEQVERHPVEIVTPDVAPPDMKQSILHGLEHIEARYAPDADDAWLFAPADMPTLQRLVIDGLIAARREHAGKVLVPHFADKPGHPVLMPWSQVTAVRKLGADQGLNAIVASERTEPIHFSRELYPPDLDSPSDYKRLRGETENSES